MSDNRWTLFPGIALATVLAVAATYVHGLNVWPLTIADGQHPIDAILIAIVFGVVVRNALPLPPWVRPGIKYCVHKLLPLAIILMGAKLDFFDVMRVSGQALAINVICVTVALVLTVWLCRKAGVATRLGLLIGVGTAICGGTAIVVTAPIIEAKDDETAFAVTTITLFGLVSIVAFPALGVALDLSQTEFGVWAGTSIQATAQVMAAGFSFGDLAGEVAVIVKLVRVLLLAPVIVVIGAWYAREKRRQQLAHVAPKAGFTTLCPPFILGFLGLALAKSLGLLPNLTVHLQDSIVWSAGTFELPASKLATAVSSFLITISMAGVGLGVHLRGLAKVGPRALYVGLIAALVLSGFSLALLKLLL